MVKSTYGLAVTVVMPVYREEERHLRLAIESILDQTWKEFQFIIILDDSENMQLKNVITGYAENDSRISFYINEENKGCPRSKDRGIRLAETEYVAIMDADDVAKEDRLEKQMYKITSEELDIVAGCVRVIDHNGNLLYCMDKLPLKHDDICKKMKVNNYMPHPTWLLRKEAYLSLGGYTDMQGCEDYDFLIRAIKGKYKLGTVGDILLDYRLSTGSVSRNNLYKQYLMMQYLQDKYYTHKHNYQSYEELCEQKYTEQRAEKYARASMHFENALTHNTEHHYFKMLISMFQVIFCSRDYCIKIIRYLGQNG